MKLSLLQLNINADNYWDNLVSFLKSNDFDVLQFQEVAGKDTFTGNVNSKRDCFAELKKLLSDKYKGEFAICERYTSSKTSYMANATFYKRNFQLVDINVLTLHKRPMPFPSDSKNFEEVGRNLLHLRLKNGNKEISFLNTHLAWAKTTKEQQHQTHQGEILFKYVQNVSKPFIFSGDFNIDPQQPLIQKINSLARNLVAENQVPNTLNERTHSAKMLFPPGAAVDYIFVSNDIRVNRFAVLEKEDISDHLGLTAEVEI